jgi:hypothetical protein
MSRRAILAMTLVCSLVATFASAQIAFAEWTDVKTGKPVVSWPVLINDPNDWSKGVRHVKPDASDPKRAYDSESGRNFAQDSDRNWIDVKTGKRVASWPVLINDPNDWSKGVRHVKPDASDPTRAFDPESGRNFANQSRSKKPAPKRAKAAPLERSAGQPSPEVGLGIEIGVGVMRERQRDRECDRYREREHGSPGFGFGTAHDSDMRRPISAP